MRLCPWCALLRWLVLLADYDHAVAAGGPDAGVVAVHKRLRLRAQPGPAHPLLQPRAAIVSQRPRADLLVTRPRRGARPDAAVDRAGVRTDDSRPRPGRGLSRAEAAAFRGHSLRAGAITQASDNGATYREIMNMTGHTQIDTVRKYDRARLHRANATRKLGL
ncbi:hypothetical protein [Nocardia gipuzkoensis]